MKKRISFLLAVIMILAVMVPAIPVIAEEPQNMWNPTAEPASYKINTPADYTAFLNYVFGSSGVDMTGLTVTLERDIDFNTCATSELKESGTNNGIDSDAWKWFNGTFDGQNHTVRGFKYVGNGVQGAGHCVGFIPNAKNSSVIKNLTIDGFYIENTAAPSAGDGHAHKREGTGALVGYAYGATIQNCTIKNGTVTAAATSTLAKCGAVAGIISSMDTKITDCIVENTVNVTSNGVETSLIGGLAGYFRQEGEGSLDLSGSKINPANADTTLPIFGAAQTAAYAGLTIKNSELLMANGAAGYSTDY